MFFPGQASELLNIPPSTLRRYANLFQDYLSEGAHRKRRRTYTEADLTKLKQIRELLNAGSTLNEVSDQLDADIETTIDVEEDTSKALTLPGLITQLEEFQAAFEQQQQEIIYLTQRVEELQQIIYLTERAEQLKQKKPKKKTTTTPTKKSKKKKKKKAKPKKKKALPKSKKSKKSKQKKKKKKR